MSGHGTDVTHQQAHASALQDIWNPHAALRLPKMHELPPLDTQLIPASLAKAFGIQLTHGDDDGDQAGQQREHQPQADVHQDSEQVQHQQQAQQLQQAGMQQAQTPYAAYPYGMEALDRQSFGQQYAGYPTQQGFNPMLMGSMQPGSAAYGAYMQPGMYDPRDAMAASYGLGQLPGGLQHPVQQQLQEQLHQQQQQQAQQQAQKQQQPATQGWQEQANGAAASAQPLQQQQQQQPAAPEEPPVPCGGAAPAAGQEGAGDEGDETSARALKRPRLVWTPKLHQRFVEAVEQLGLKNAVPKTIMQLMNVEGLTRENVASHLQKFRLQQKKDVRAEGNAPADALAATPGQHRLVSGGTGTGGGTGESGGVHSTEGPDQAGAHNGGSSDDPADRAAADHAGDNMQQSREMGAPGGGSAVQVKAEDARATDGREQAAAPPARQP